MATVGPGVREIRVQTGRAHRVFFVATFAEAVYVLHVFEKKKRRTSQHDIELGNERFKAVVAERTRHGT
jgi:phage-related protein